MIIDNSSLHPYTHKLAAFRCYIHRLLNTPLSPIDYTKEFNIIKQIALNNGYKVEVIDKLIESISLKQALKSVYPTVKKNLIDFIRLHTLENLLNHSQAFATQKLQDFLYDL